MKVFLVAAVLCALIFSVSDAAWPRIATKLNNPRHLAFGHGFDADSLYIAEAGMGSNKPADKSDACIDDDEHPGGKACYGLTGSITRVNLNAGTVRRVVKGLPSVASSAANSSDTSVVTGSFATGPSAVSSVSLFCANDNHDDTIGDDMPAQPLDSSRRFSPLVYGTVTCTDRTSVNSLRDQGADLSLFGKVLQYHEQSDGTFTTTVVADPCSFEFKNDADKTGPDSDPNAILSVRNPSTGFIEHLVADTGANDVLKIDNTGKISVAAVLPARSLNANGNTFSVQSVPTSLTLLNGEVLVGELTGFPFRQGFARVSRLSDTSDNGLSTFASGFTNIVDMTHDMDGNLYVLEILSKGLSVGPADKDFRAGLIKVRPDGTRTRLLPCASNDNNCEDLIWGGGITFRNETLYVSHNSILPGRGEVVAIPLSQLTERPF